MIFQVCLKTWMSLINEAISFGILLEKDLTYISIYTDGEAHHGTLTCLARARYNMFEALGLGQPRMDNK